MMPTHQQPSRARAGDWIEQRGVDGRCVRRGQIVEVLGLGRHSRYRVRWDEWQESIVYPADGVLVIPKAEILVTD